MAGIKENSELEFVWVEPEKAIKHKDNKVADNIKTGFYISKYLVTQHLWETVTGNNPSWFKKGGNYPVEYVSLKQIFNEFLPALNDMFKGSGFGFRLPTEAEWEYSCMAGSEKTYYWGNSFDEAYCWYHDNSGSTTHQVGMKLPNACGIYDMTGNVWEWCQNLYNDYPAYSLIEISKHKPADDAIFSCRGASWFRDKEYCRTLYRNFARMDSRYSDLGFRLVLFKDPE